MKTLIVLSFSSLLVCLGGCAREERPAHPVFAEGVVDLGVLDPGEGTFSVSFRNGGTVPLRVEKVGSTCSCTSAEATPVVGPAGTGALHGKVKVQGGPGGAELSLAIAGPGESKKIRLKWFGRSSPTLLPDSLDVRMKAGTSESRQVEVSYPAGDPPVPLVFVGVTGLPEGSRAELIANDPAAIKSIPGLGASMDSSPSPFLGKAGLRVDLRAASVPGPAVYACVVTFVQQSKPIALPFEVRIRVDEGLRCHPDSLLFSAGDFEGLRKIRRTAMLRSDLPGDRFEVVEKPAYLEARVTPAAAGTSGALLTAEVVSPPPVGEGNRRVVVRDSTGRRVEVAVFIGLDR